MFYRRCHLLRVSDLKKWVYDAVRSLFNALWPVQLNFGNGPPCLLASLKQYRKIQHCSLIISIVLAGASIKGSGLQYLECVGPAVDRSPPIFNGQFYSITEIYPRQTLVAIVMKICCNLISIGVMSFRHPQIKSHFSAPP